MVTFRPYVPGQKGPHLGKVNILKQFNIIRRKLISFFERVAVKKTKGRKKVWKT